MYELIPIGKFVNVTGSFVVNDPCYHSVDAGNKIPRCAGGTWNAWRSESDEGDWGVRNAALLVLHSSVRVGSAFRVNPKVWGTKEKADDEGLTRLTVLSKWQCTEYGTGVDSGQAGFYNGDYLRRHKARDEGGEAWYSTICNGSDKGIVTKNPTGVTTSSGLGDGSYGVWMIQRDGLAVALCLDFGLGWMQERLEHELIQTADPKELPGLLPFVSDRNRGALTERIGGANATTL